MAAWYAKKWSELIVNRIAFPVYSDIDISENMTKRKFGELEPNLNGVMRHMYGTDPSLSRKVDYTWSSSRVRRPPAFFDLWDGDEIVVVPIIPWSMVIPAGQTSIVLNRDPYPGSVLIEHLATGEFLPPGYSVDGRTVSLPSALDADCLAGFKPTLTMLFDDRSNGKSEFAASGNWQFSAKEK